MPNNLDAFVPERWSLRVLEKIDQLNVALAVMTNTDYEGEVRVAGDTVRVRTFGNITVQDYERGTPIAAESLVPTVESLIVDKSKYFAFDVDDLDQAQNDINAILGYTARAGVAMSNAIDRYIFGLALGGATLAVGTAGTPINITPATATTTVYDQIVAAGLLLDQNDVDEDGRWIIVTPYAKSLLLSDTIHFIRASDMGDAVVQSSRIGMTAGPAGRRGFIGTISNFEVWASNHVPTNGTYWACPFGQGEPISYAAQIPPSKMQAFILENTFATRVRGLLLHGGKVFAEPAKKLGILYIDNS